MDALKVMQQGYGLYSFDMGGSLLVWAATLLYGEPRSVGANAPETISEPGLSDFEYPLSGGSVVQNRPRSPASADIDPHSIDVVSRRGEAVKQPTTVPTRPNLTAAFDNAQGYRRLNPLLEQWAVTALGDGTLEPFLVEDQIYRGAHWAAQTLTQLGQSTTLVSLDRVRLLKVEATARVVASFLASNLGDEKTKALIQRFKRNEYRALTADYAQFEARLMRDFEQWKAYGAVPVVDEYQSVHTLLTAANVATALVAIHGLLSLFSEVRCFYQGVNEVIGCLDSLYE